MLLTNNFFYVIPCICKLILHNTLTPGSTTFKASFIKCCIETVLNLILHPFFTTKCVRVIHSTNIRTENMWRRLVSINHKWSCEQLSSFKSPPFNVYIIDINKRAHLSVRILYEALQEWHIFPKTCNTRTSKSAHICLDPNVALNNVCTWS